MAYKVPNFPLKCKVWHAVLQPTVFPLPAAPDLTDVPCQLTYGSRVHVPFETSGSFMGIVTVAMSLLVAKLTDIRGPDTANSCDMVEVPQGSGRWYFVYGVDDIGKGFSNEHRFASIVPQYAYWTKPYA